MAGEACMPGGVHGWGVCIGEGCVWRGHAWQGACVEGHAWRGVCMAVECILVL